MVQLVEIEGAAGDQPLAAQPGQYGLVGGVWRVPAQQLGGVGEQGVGRQRLDLLARQTFMFSAPSARTRCLRRQVPLRQRRDHEAILQGVHRRVLGRTVGLDQQPGQDMGGGRVDARHAGRQGAAPAGRHQHGVALGGAGAALAQDGESVVPQVHQRQRVQPAAGVGHGQHHGAGAQVQPGRAAACRDWPRGGGAGLGQAAHEGVGVGRRVLRGMGGLASRQIHDQQRVEVQIAFHRGLVRGLGGGRGRVGRRRAGARDGQTAARDRDRISGATRRIGAPTDLRGSRAMVPVPRLSKIRENRDPAVRLPACAWPALPCPRVRKLRNLRGGRVAYIRVIAAVE